MARSYDQYCPLARALDIVGDRWAMLIVRELLFSPKRFSDLENHLEGIAPNLLSRRLKEMEAAGLIAQRRLGPPTGTNVYELTEQGRSLEAAVFELARWGVQFMGDYEGEEAFRPEWLFPVMEDFADRDAARGVTEVYEFRLDGSAFWVNVNDGEVTFRAGAAPVTPDLVVDTDLETFMAVGFGTLTPEEAEARRPGHIMGDPATMERALNILAPARIFEKLASASTTPLASA